MAQATALPGTDPHGALTEPEAIAAQPVSEAPDRLFWTRRFSLTTRILAVNVLIVGLVLGGLFFLDTYRKQLIAERFKLARSEVEIIANALAEAPSSEHAALLARIGTEQRLRLRTFDALGELQTDSFVVGEPSFTYIDPETETWVQEFARWLDRSVDFLVGAPPVPPYDPQDDAVDADKSDWPEIFVAEQAGQGTVMLRYAPDRTPVITAAAPYGAQGETLLTMRNALDITQSVRSARQTLLILLALGILFSIQLSLFLARTIVQPLKLLSRAAARVRLGRDREVVVPRLPERGDEIGMLARALSDMSGALRERIDAGEAFAADVSHELKNPLASLRSALDTLETVEDPKLRDQLVDIAKADVRRLDRLITEIAELTRVDAELSRVTFTPVDLYALAEGVIGSRNAMAQQRGEEQDIAFAVQSAPTSATMVMGDAARLERVLENLVGNAASFSPAGGRVTVAFSDLGDRVEMTVTDDGPGVPEDAREKIFERFHSYRPDADFGSHSGLGLAIARSIMAAHDGTLSVRDRADGQSGAVMVVTMPSLEPET